MDEDDFPRTPKTIKGYIAQFKETGKTFRWIWDHVVTSLARVWIGRLSMIMFVKSLLEMLQPWLIAMLIKNKDDNRQLLIYFVAFAGVRYAYAYMGFYNNKAREWIFGTVFQSLDDQITRLFFEKSIGQYIQEGSELSISNIDKGRGRIWDLTFTLAFQAVPMVCGFVASFIALWVLSPVIGGIATLAIVIFFAWLFWLNARTMTACIPIEKDFRLLNRYRLERWEHAERVKLRNQEHVELKEMDRRFTDVITRDRTFWVWFGKHIAIRESVMTMAILSMIAYAIYLSRINIWNVAMLIPIFMWSLKLAGDLEQLGHIERQISWNMPSIQSMIRAITTPPDVDECLDGHDATQDESIRIEFVEISHSFPEKREKSKAAKKDPKPMVEILQGINFSIEPGEKVALIGPSGSGKSTLMRLGIRAMDSTGGCIRLNGYNLREVSLPTYRKRVAYIPQSPRVFDGTIRYNLTYGVKMPPSDAELTDLLARLKLDDPKRFAGGLDTIIGKNGQQLSGGQLQRLIIGAAIVQRADFFVIDEATSHLDSTTEKEVMQQGLNQALAGNVSALIIAHRLSTVEEICSKYIVLRQLSSVKPGESQIDAIGSSYSELYKTSAVFKGLADDQHLLIRGYRSSPDIAQKEVISCFAS